MSETCPYHALMEDFKKRTEHHVEEGERPGGVRDRVFIIEQTIKALGITLNEMKEIHSKEISTIKQGYWKACIVAGSIGGLISGQLGPEVIRVALKYIFGINF